MDFCNCIDEWSSDFSMVKFLDPLDLMTALTYFAILMELIYFIWRSPILPQKMFNYFGAFTIVCGATCVTKSWIYAQCLESSTLVMPSFLQVFTPLVSWLTVMVMVFEIPKFMYLKKSEKFLKNRVNELSVESSRMLQEAATRRSILRLINDIRSTLDGELIVQSTVSGLGEIFNLEECLLWLPSLGNKSLSLYLSLSHSISVGSSVPISLPVVTEIFNNIGAVKIPYTCPLIRDTKFTKKGMTPEAVAIRVPLRNVLLPESVDSRDSYAVMVLILPSDNIRTFHDYDLELLGAVAEQVSVALAHASAIEKSIAASEKLKNQNSTLELALQDMETALRALVHSENVIFRQPAMPLNAMTALSSILLENTFMPLQRAMAEMVLRSRSSLETLLLNERDLSELQDGILELHPRAFNLSNAIKQAVDMIIPAAETKNLSLSLVLAPDLPVNAIGDFERLMQVLVNVIGNAVKFTKEGHVLVSASVVNTNTYRAWQHCQLVSSDVHFYLKVQVEDSGCGIDPQGIPNLLHPSRTSNSRGKLGLVVCKRLLNVMDGDIWIESDGLGKGCTATFIVKLDLVD